MELYGKPTFLLHSFFVSGNRCMKILTLMNRWINLSVDRWMNPETGLGEPQTQKVPDPRLERGVWLGFPETTLAVLYGSGVLVRQLRPATLWWKASSGHHVVVCCFTNPRALCGPSQKSLAAPKGQKIAHFHHYVIYLCSFPSLLFLRYRPEWPLTLFL